MGLSMDGGVYFGPCGFKKGDKSTNQSTFFKRRDMASS